MLKEKQKRKEEEKKRNSPSSPEGENNENVEFLKEKVTAKVNTKEMKKGVEELIEKKKK